MVGFAVKAGLVPFHSWLPDAHPVAPSSISAPMSGIVTKAGVYGLIKVLFVLFGAGALSKAAASDGSFSAFGLALSTLGALTVLFAEIMALRERELKRMLAYSTLAQVGEIVAVLGIGSYLAMAGATLHVLNHAVMKSLLFLAAGSFIFRLGHHRIDEFKGGRPGHAGDRPVLRRRRPGGDGIAAVLRVLQQVPDDLRLCRGRPVAARRHHPGRQRDRRPSTMRAVIRILFFEPYEGPWVPRRRCPCCWPPAR